VSRPSRIAAFITSCNCAALTGVSAPSVCVSAAPTAAATLLDSESRPSVIAAFIAKNAVVVDDSVSAPSVLLNAAAIGSVAVAEIVSAPSVIASAAFEPAARDVAPLDNLSAPSVLLSAAATDSVAPLDNVSAPSILLSVAAAGNVAADEIVSAPLSSAKKAPRSVNPVPAAGALGDEPPNALTDCRIDLDHQLCTFSRTRTGLINYATFDTADGKTYAVFFDVMRYKTRGPNTVLLTIESAYELAEAKRDTREGRVSFNVLLGHALRGTKPNPPPRAR
jgi:hypothetical protein